ncbi:hypothetical protein [Aureimonas sp. SK2]|uniref:hypothetical protein n=1 Tax=Aureimonas sp. SK2 TaxID=3015992 RepID=UPI002445116C|nr:hypothetical protein [Aureimonas sp. SK2]
MAASPRAKLALAGPNFSPVPAMPLGGPVTVFDVASGAATSHAVGTETTLVQLTTSADVYYGVGGPANAGSLLLYAKGTATHAVSRNAELSFRAVSGSATVRLLEA